MNAMKTTNMPALDQHNRVSSEELEQIVLTNCRSAMADPESSFNVPPLMVWGPPGCGKSTIIKNAAAKLGIKFVDFRLSQREPVDLKGLPVPNKETNTVEWFPTSDLPTDQDSAGILLFDEISAADRSLQVAAYELILDRRLGNTYTMPKKWVIIAAGNRTQDRAVATTMSSALANRFMHVEIEPDQESWTKWAQFNGIHPSVVGFIQYRPDKLFNMKDENLERGWPSPRAWERVSHVLKIYSGAKTEFVRKLVYGLVGNRAGVEFMEFHALNQEFDNILEIMTNPKSVINIPKQPDRKYAMCSAMNYLLWRGKDEADERARITGFIRICIELPSDFAALAIKAAMNGNDPTKSDEYCDKLVTHPLYSKWAAKHGSAIGKYNEKVVG